MVSDVYRMNDIIHAQCFFLLLGMVLLYRDACASETKEILAPFCTLYNYLLQFDHIHRSFVFVQCIVNHNGIYCTYVIWQGNASCIEGEIGTNSLCACKYKLPQEECFGT